MTAINPSILVSAVFAVLATPALADDICVPPVLPYLPVTQDEADEFGSFVAQDAQQYFTDAGDYINCLERERARVYSEVQEFTDAYASYIESMR